MLNSKNLINEELEIWIKRTDRLQEFLLIIKNVILPEDIEAEIKHKLNEDIENCESQIKFLIDDINKLNDSNKK
jgi:hypothetical protein